MHKTLFPVIAALALALPAAATAQQQSATFDLHVLGLKAGTFSYSAVEQGGQYAVTGRLDSGGLIGALRKMRFNASVNGLVNGATLIPARYEGSSDSGRRQSESAMQYRAGVPQIVSYSPPREPGVRDLDPTTQAGTLDPLSALYAGLRDVPAAQACTQNITIFDGRRRSETVVANRAQSGDRITCTGEYRRVAGYSERDMAERRVHPFRMTYTLGQDGIARVTEVRADTTYGRAVLSRR